MDSLQRSETVLEQPSSDETARASGKPERLEEHIVEIISDSGEGAQKCGQSFAAIAARMGNGIWTTEIIPAEIQPPARSVEGASGNRIRLSSHPVTNGGDETDLAIAFNEQVLIGRMRAGELKPDATILLEDKWRHDRNPDVVASYNALCEELKGKDYKVYEVPMEEECLKIVRDPRKGKNMFVLGMLCGIYNLDLQKARDQIAFIFAKKAQAIIDSNIELLQAGYAYAKEHLDFEYEIPAPAPTDAKIVVNGNTALALGTLASGMQVCSMYPITPATSVSHYLSDVFEKVGGVVHQAEDEIAACAFAIGASYSGNCALTVTSGPGFSLKQETMGLAVMAEIPLVVVNVQRGGPSTGQPTKMEQGDLLTACFGSHGDAPKVVIAPSTIEDCFYSMITARRIAETFRVVVVVLTDASLATAQQPIPRPNFSKDWLAPPLDQTPLDDDANPYEWDEKTGLSRRIIPGQPNGMHCLTGLAHNEESCVAYDSSVNQKGIKARSLKLATLQKSLAPVEIYGDDEGDLLIVGWGSTKGAIEETVDRLRRNGHAVSSIHLRFIQPLPPGIKEALQGFKKVITVENSWCDQPDGEIIDTENMRYSNLAWLLRARFLVDIECCSEVMGRPISPTTIEQFVVGKLGGE